MTAIISGEGVALDLAPAGVGTRVLASLIDIAVQAIAYLVFAIVASRTFGDAAGGAFYVLGLIVAFGVYPVVFEWLSRGKTLGKLAMGIRVVRDDGGPIGFRQALVRGLSSLLLEKTLVTGLIGTAAGLITAIFTQRNKRLGDLMAGTFVVNERTGLSNAQATAPQYWVPPELVPWAMSLDLTRLDDQLALGVRQFVMRASQMSPAAQNALGADFRARLEAVIAPQPPMAIPTSLMLTIVLAERRRRAELVKPPRW